MFLDLSKAFDTIDNKILYKNLNGTKYEERKTLEWFKIYLTIEYNMSNTIISNLKYMIWHAEYHRDLFWVRYYCVRSCKSILFADDTTLCASSVNISQLYNMKQSTQILSCSRSGFEQINYLSMLVKHIVSSLNVFKCNNIYITGSFEVKIGNSIVEKENCAKCLGILIDSKLEWHDDIRYVQNKMQSALFAMWRVKQILNTNFWKFCIIYWSVHTLIMK